MDAESIDAQLRVGLAAFGVIELLLGAWMAIAPHSFFTQVGPFGLFNSHYVRDLATYNLAFAAGLLVAVRMPSWRVPVLVIAIVQYTLHSLNHLLDISKASPAWLGYANFAALTIATLTLIYLLTLALRVRA